jgi:diguanylate cyclase (GGDEF)-like protein
MTQPLNRLIDSISIMQVLIALILLGTIIYAGVAMNRATVQSEHALVDNALSKSVIRVTQELKSVAIWDDAVVALRPEKLDRAWADEEIGKFLYETYGHQQTFVVGSDNQTLVAYTHGKFVDTAQFSSILKLAEPLIRDIRRAQSTRLSRTDGSTLRLHQRAEFMQSEKYIRWAGNILSIDGKPVLLAGMTIVPTKNKSLATARPPILLSVVKVNQGLVNDIGDSLMLSDLTVLPLSATRDNVTEELLTSDANRAVSKLVWTSVKPGSLLLKLVLPMVLIAMLAAALTTRTLLRRLRRSTDDLAEREAKAIHEATHDALSGLPNRRAFIQTVERQLAKCRTNGGRLVVAYIDIDHFKDVNDTLGHRMGDKLITAVGTRLKSALRPGDVLARFGGDEFAALRVIEDGEHPISLGKDISRAFALPIDLFEQSLRVTGSIGIAQVADYNLTISDIMRHADIALYQAKDNGRACHVLFSDEMAESIEERRVIETDLQKAIADGAMTMVYQPLIDCTSNKIKGVEALVRWSHKTRGPISPGVFIPIAEETGLMPALGEWVLEKVFADAQKWPGLEVAVNLSPAQIRHLNLVPVLRKLLAKFNMDASRIVLEITEGVLLEQTEKTAATLKEIVDLGFKLALDDFGTGYSSLSYLRHFRFDKIKIDQSFVQGATEESQAFKIVRAVTDLGKSLNMSVVAEGIENEDEAQLMINAGCNELQGYYFSRPVQGAAIDAFFAVPASQLDLDVRRIGKA